MGEVRGQFAESGELFRLLLHAGDLADAVEEDGDAALRHGWNGGEHVGEHLHGDVDGPERANGVAVAP